MRSPRAVFTVAAGTILLVVCSALLAFTSPPIELGIKARHAPGSFRRGVLTEVPAYDEATRHPFQVDLRHYDLRNADLTDRLQDLIHADFDVYTQWPTDLPEGFDPEKYMELGKNPGLGIRELHQRGITGKDVGIAIIDQTLLVDHVEYKDQLRHYEQLSHDEQPWRYEPPQFNDQLRAYGPIRTAAEQYPASMHAPAVASIAVGKSVGVAPEADLYMISPDWKIVNGMEDFTDLARAVDRVVAINRQLPEGRKIRVLSMSTGWTYAWLCSPGGYSAIVEAVRRAKAQGIFVVSSSLSITYEGFAFHGLGRDPLADPDETGSYGPGAWWADYYYRTGTIADGTEALLVPMDCRATAAMCSPVDYAFYAEGGWSWCAPYIAGLYAMACQVKPDVTPEVFWKAALATGDTVTLSRNDKTYDFGKIVNPVKLMEALANPD